MRLAKKLRVCPKCFGTTINLFLGGYAGKLYKCGDCNYIGPIIIETTNQNYESLVKWTKEERESARAL